MSHFFPACESGKEQNNRFWEGSSQRETLQRHLRGVNTSQDWDTSLAWRVVGASSDHMQCSTWLLIKISNKRLSHNFQRKKTMGPSHLHTEFKADSL